MTTISGISKKTFMEATRVALAQIKGAPVKLSQLRQFVAAQFKLNNEHLIEQMFSAQSLPSLAHEPLGALDIDIGARGIVFNQLQNMFVYSNADGHIGGYWSSNHWSSTRHCDRDNDVYFVPLSQVEWWQESAFVFPSRDECRRSLPPELAEDPHYRIVEVRELPDLSKALIDAVMFSTLPASDAERSLDMLTHFFGATRDAHQNEVQYRPVPASYSKYVHNAFRYMLTRMLPATSYPNIERSTCVATFYGDECGFGEDVSGLPLFQRIALWAANGDHGLSSQFLFSHMSGLLSLDLVSSSKKNANTPYDTDAFKCCVQLLECIPEWKLRMKEMAQYDAWGPYVEAWGVLTSTLMNESNLTDEPLYDRRNHNTQRVLDELRRR